jgi:hypothetical protein
VLDLVPRASPNHAPPSALTGHTTDQCAASFSGCTARFHRRCNGEPGQGPSFFGRTARFRRRCICEIGQESTRHITNFSYRTASRFTGDSSHGRHDKRLLGAGFVLVLTATALILRSNRALGQCGRSILSAVESAGPRACCSRRRSRARWRPRGRGSCGVRIAVVRAVLEEARYAGAGPEEDLAGAVLRCGGAFGDPYWPRDRYLELAPEYWRAKRARRALPGAAGQPERPLVLRAAGLAEARAELLRCLSNVSAFCASRRPSSRSRRVLGPPLLRRRGLDHRDQRGFPSRRRTVISCVRMTLSRSNDACTVSAPAGNLSSCQAPVLESR